MFMRVLMVSHLYPSRADSVYGSFVHSQVKALEALGCNVPVLAPTPAAPFPLNLMKEKWRRFHATPKLDNYQGVTVAYPRIIRTPRAALFSLARWNYYCALKPWVRRWHKQEALDLVHAQIAYPDGWAAARLAAELGLPLVLTLHGQELQKISRWSKKLEALVASVLTKAAAVAVPSEKMRALAMEQGVAPKKLHLVANGLDPLPAAKLPLAIQEKLIGKKILLSVGRLEREKGFQYNIRALARLADKHPELTYLVVGEGSYRKDLEELANSLGLARRVLFAGYQSREQIGAYYAASHLFSMPSKDEAFGIVYLEAMAAGLPVIGAHGEGIAPLIQESGAGGLASFGAVAELAEEISRLLAPAVAAAAGLRGQTTATAYTWRRNAESMLAIYTKTIGR